MGFFLYDISLLSMARAVQSTSILRHNEVLFVIVEMKRNNWIIFLKALLHMPLDDISHNID